MVSQPHGGIDVHTVPGYTRPDAVSADPGRAALATHTLATHTLATHTATGVLVAIRYVPDDRRRDDAWLVSYRDDARRLAAVDSPHLAALYEYVEAADWAATVREYVDGVSLPVLIAGGRLRPEAALTVLKGVLVGRLAAAAGEVRQCRYEPTSVLVDRQGRVKLTDSGDELADGSLADDVRAVFATFLDCLAGATAEAGSAGTDKRKLPRRLGPLVAPAAEGDGPALLAALEAAARAVHGADWEAAGRRRLARAVARQSGSSRSSRTWR